MKRHLIPPFRSGPWTASTAPVDAQHVDGVAVTERLATRADGQGAVVRLANGRLAVLGGGTFAVGHPMLLLQLHAARRAGQARTEDDRVWWSEVRRVLQTATGGSSLLTGAPRVGTAGL
ncbi:MAG TPA: hypothetical protein VN238_22545 [Solirubrobacteraceae bacterium]|nr:hypothetical protein [Solirubrobacteraceae bacterium]